MSWNTGVLAGGTALLALALGGVQGLLVAIALFVFLWLARSIGIAGAAHRGKRSQPRNAQQRAAERKVEQEQRSQQQRQAEHECESERRHQCHSELAAQQENEWWSVLEVAPHASTDEIRRAYRRKIWQCHPDRVAGLAPELLELAETSTRTLNAAYSEANRARRIESAVR